ncbi:hypothetical protein KIN20_000854 [Parelaphostrongylus tenuis]|uniref:Uncharacterized protein n=1 Tax=Parelaphostrongylus tenuis TaxID=148309 RepID=A0AAD5MBZ0_PARTN|nr:hypothetical protein KIN20_000854 [Parelaphostrongylus tenuis]
MAFYGEDEIFCNVPHPREESRTTTNIKSKRMRYDEAIASSIDEQEISWFDASSSKLDALDAIGEVENDPEEGCVKRNPWVSKVLSKKRMRKTLRRFILGLVVLACQNEHLENLQLKQSHKDAFQSIDHLNEEIVRSLEALGNFSIEQMRCAKSNCQKAFIPKQFASALVTQFTGDYTKCQVRECPRTVESLDVNYLILEGGLYSHRLEMPDHTKEPDSRKLLCLCSFHSGIFEFMFDMIHMKWNIYQNCLVRVKQVLKNKRLDSSADFPSVVLENLISFYMARYFCVWAFGNNELWQENGCTLFQVLGSK